MEHECPNCKTKLQWDSNSPHRPFCSEQCKNKDFIAWANEENKFPGTPEYDNFLSDELDKPL